MLQSQDQRVGGKVCYEPRRPIRPIRPIRPALISGYCSIKRLGVFLLPPGWDASPSQGLPPAWNSPVPIHTPGWREASWEWSVLPKNTTQCPRPGPEPGLLDPESSALIMRPPRFPHPPPPPKGGKWWEMDCNENLSLVFTSDASRSASRSISSLCKWKRTSA